MSEFIVPFQITILPLLKLSPHLHINISSERLTDSFRRFYSLSPFLFLCTRCPMLLLKSMQLTFSLGLINRICNGIHDNPGHWSPNEDK